jgi:hypothetical protein
MSLVSVDQSIDVTSNMSNNSLAQVNVREEDNLKDFSRPSEDQVLQEKKEVEISITVATLRREKFTFNINPDRLIEDVAIQVETIAGYPRNQQRIIFVGRELEMNRSLNDYNIKANNTLHMVLKLRGGMYDASSGHNGFGLI